MPLEHRISNRDARVGVVGLGYVGLPLALAFCESGFSVLGFDIQQKRVDLVNQGVPYVADVSETSLKAALAKNLLEATTDQSRLREMDVCCICVPTPLTRAKEPDLSQVLHEARQVSRFLRPGQLVVLESTTYPGTTREVLMPILEEGGLKAGVDFYLAFSPERVDPGSRSHNIRNTPKILGGIEPQSTALAEILYRQVVDVVIAVSSPEIAEMTKVFENVFRGVNIALVNELVQLCEKMGISAWEVIDAAATKPFGYMPFYPGPGVGGHCIPLDPYYLANKAREYDFHTRFIELAADINENMPHYVVSRIVDALGSTGKSLNGARLLILGAAYKRDVADTRESPSLKLIEFLLRKGAIVDYNDPYVGEIHVSGNTLTSVELTEERLRAADCVVVATDHRWYDYSHIAKNSSLIFDSRGATRGITDGRIVML